MHDSQIFLAGLCAGVVLGTGLTALLYAVMVLRNRPRELRRSMLDHPSVTRGAHIKVKPAIDIPLDKEVW
jgi:TRAP-type C4-dicarboxylate transport system permease large subunit